MGVWSRQQDSGKGKSWLPTWRKGEHVLPKGKQPGGYEENVQGVMVSAVQMAGDLTMTNRMTDQTYRKAVSLNLM